MFVSLLPCSRLRLNASLQYASSRFFLAVFFAHFLRAVVFVFLLLCNRRRASSSLQPSACFFCIATYFVSLLPCKFLRVFFLALCDVSSLQSVISSLQNGEVFVVRNLFGSSKKPTSQSKQPTMTPTNRTTKQATAKHAQKNQPINQQTDRPTNRQTNRPTTPAKK